MKEKSLKSNVIYNLFWKLLERGGTQGIQFLVQLLLARLLTPADYGIIALITIFIQIANVFIQSGFNTALIQKKDADEIDFSSVFFLSLLVAFLLYILLFFFAPYIADFYGNPVIVNVIRVLSITFFFGAINSIQNAIIAKRMQFKKLFYSSIIAVIVSSTIAIIMAFNGAGVWVLVVQQLISQFLITLVLWFTVKWRPRLLFSFSRLKKLFSFSSKILISSLLETVYTNLRGLIIGKIYNSSALGYYNRGQQFPSVIITNLNGSIQSVMLPVMSSEQENLKKVKSIVRRSISVSSFIVFPLMIGLAIIAEPLILITLTDKWLPAVPFLQIYCLSYAFWPIHTSNLQAINALGRSDIFLRLEVIKKIVGIVILLTSIQYGIYAIALGEVVSSFIASIINAHPNKKLLNYGFREQVKDIFPSFLLSIMMGIVIYYIGTLDLNIIIQLIIQVITGIIIYSALAKIFKNETFEYLLKTISRKNN